MDYGKYNRIKELVEGLEPIEYIPLKSALIEFNFENEAEVFYEMADDQLQGGNQDKAASLEQIAYGYEKLGQHVREKLSDN